MSPGPQALAAAFSPDGSFLYASTGNGEQLVWATNSSGTDSATWSFAVPDNSLCDLAVSPDGLSIYVLGCTESNVHHLRLDGANGAVETLTTYSVHTSVTGSGSGDVLGMQAVDMTVVVSRIDSNEVVVFHREASTGGLSTATTIRLDSSTYPGLQAVSGVVGAIALSGAKLFVSLSAPNDNGGLVVLDVACTPPDPVLAGTPAPTGPPANGTTAPTVADTPGPTAVNDTIAPEITPTPGPTAVNDVIAPEIAPTPAPVVQSDAPTLRSAVMSNTESLITLQFSGTSFCSEGTWSGADVSLCGYDAALGDFDYWCDIERLLDQGTLSLLGNGSTCEWSADSLAAFVSYDETYDDFLAAKRRNITMGGGYILAEVSSVSSTTEYTTGTVVLEGRTAPPELLQAQFSDDGGSIVVTFSAEGSASSGLLDPGDSASGSGPGSCLALLNASSIPPLGDGATCEWTGERELTIRPGYEAYVLPGLGSNASCTGPTSCITLVDGGVRTEAFAKLSSSGSRPVLAPANPPAVAAVLVAPQTVGRCGGLRLDGRASSGSASRTLSASWSVSAATGASMNVSADIDDSLAPFQGSLLADLDATALAIGVEVTFHLSVQNVFGSVDQATATVTRSDDDVPSVVILGSSTRTVVRSRSTSLRMAATPPACGESQLLTFEWSQAGGAGFDTIGTETWEGLERRDPTTLTLPAYTLGVAGSVYLFTATATSQTSQRSSTASVEVSVGQGALRAVITGGQFRQHTAGGDLVLDGSGSWDEDELALGGLSYTWWCSKNCTDLDGGGWTTAADGSVVTIPADEMESGEIYEFSLNVSDAIEDGVASSQAGAPLRLDTTGVKVQVISFEAPEVVVVAKDSTLKHDPTRKVVVFGSANEQIRGEYDLQWTQTEGDLDLEEREWSTFFTTSQSGSNLVVRPDVLTGGVTYAFRLSATDSVTLATGFAELSVVVNAAPTGGYVDASPRAGSAAVDSFSLQSLEWTDEVDDLPLLYSFAYMNDQEDATGQAQLSLSMFATESAEWEGLLPLGLPSSNYTIFIAGHVADSYGAKAIATKDDAGEAVAVRVTAWSAFLNDSTTSLLDIYSAALQVTGDVPGTATSMVRAYASLLAEERDDSSPQLSAEETESYQEMTTTMIRDVANDFEVLEYSPATAGAVLDTLALVSGSQVSLTRNSQDALLSVSAGVLARGVNQSSWDSGGFAPTLDLIDNVMGGYNASSAGVVGRDSLGEETAELLPVMLRSIGSLMESALEDGEDPTVIGNDYINVLCQDVALLAPVRITMSASMTSTPAGSAIPSCSYYNEGTGEWNSAGLAFESMAMSPSGDGAGSKVNVTCLSFHLSDFTVSADEVDAVFRPVSLTAAGSVVLMAREVSMMGVVLLGMVLLLLVMLRTLSRVADTNNKLATQLEEKADAWYIANGKLTLLIFASVMVHMMVEASFIGNSTDYKVLITQSLVSLAASMPGSIIIPKLFAAAAAPPDSVMAERIRDPVVRSGEKSSTTSGSNANSGPDMKGSRWLRDSNSLVAVFHLISATATSTFKPDAGGSVIARGTSLVWSGLWQIVLDLAHIVLLAIIGIEDNLGKALMLAAVAGEEGSAESRYLSSADAILATRTSSFTIINFKLLFVLVFVRMVLTALQIVMSFHQRRNTENGLSWTVFGVSIIKLILIHKSELLPCMDAVNQSYMSTVSMVKRYRPPQVNRSHEHISSTRDVHVCSWRESAAIKIQAIVRMHQAYTSNVS
eukprot:g10216.t1